MFLGLYSLVFENMRSVGNVRVHSEQDRVPQNDMEEKKELDR